MNSDLAKHEAPYPPPESVVIFADALTFILPQTPCSDDSSRPTSAPTPQGQVMHVYDYLGSLGGDAHMPHSSKVVS